MSIKTKALFQAILVTFGVLGTALGTTYLLSLLSPQAPTYLSLGVLIGALIYMAYTFLLSRLESQEILKSINITK